nr:MAG TPA: hypothetical protein [Caudoviricetes sp.]
MKIGDLIVVGLINSVIFGFIAGIIYLIVLAIMTIPFVVLTIVFFLLVGFTSAFIYLKIKEKEEK